MTSEILHYIQFLNLNPPHFHVILLPLAPLSGALGARRLGDREPGLPGALAPPHRA